jgi:hypothetical protein
MNYGLIQLYNFFKRFEIVYLLLICLIFLYYIFGLYILIDDYNLFKILEKIL